LLNSFTCSYSGLLLFAEETPKLVLLGETFGWVIADCTKRECELLN